jgi:hypothetical protein
MPARHILLRRPPRAVPPSWMRIERTESDRLPVSPALGCDAAADPVFPAVSTVLLYRTPAFEPDPFGVRRCCVRKPRNAFRKSLRSRPSSSEAAERQIACQIDLRTIRSLSYKQKNSGTEVSDGLRITSAGSHLGSQTFVRHCLWNPHKPVGVDPMSRI